ncbi:hypothetical protein GCM10023191_100300 [Actinoallomurus oryzae]|jgi:hypothetical protein|uniref:Uncharacterized protein n=1 Tax=Actinoallomurus oryzae TaxID=502180 RepID=A0ABP8R8Y7_9ACTN
MTKLAGELAAIECKLADLATTLIPITQHEATPADTAVIGEPYREILAAFTFDNRGLCARDLCHARRHRRHPRQAEMPRQRPDLGGVTRLSSPSAQTDAASWTCRS